MTLQQASPGTPADFSGWFDISALQQTAEEPATLLSAFKECLANGKTVLAERFSNGTDTGLLLAARSWLVDQVLCASWTYFLGEDADTAALVAVGGYGRSELMMSE